MRPITTALIVLAFGILRPPSSYAATPGITAATAPATPTTAEDELEADEGDDGSGTTVTTPSTAASSASPITTATSSPVGTPTTTQVTSTVKAPPRKAKKSTTLGPEAITAIIVGSVAAIMLVMYFVVAGRNRTGSPGGFSVTDASNLMDKAVKEGAFPSFYAAKRL